ncbi:MAG: hypothetical protein R3F14_20380 [Polyangiaceae bacterium]
MTRTWLGAVVAIGSLVVAGAVGCDGGETTGPGGGGSGATGGGGSGATGGGGSGATGGGGTMMTTTTTTPNDPCDGIPEGDFVPEWKPSTGLHQGLCTEAQIDELFAACLEAGATQATCDAFLMDAANKGCSTCVLSASDASEYGPIVVYQDLNLLYETRASASPSWRATRAIRAVERRCTLRSTARCPPVSTAATWTIPRS